LGIERLKLEGVGEAAEQLRRADRLKDALLAAVSHDLRTPLTTIKAIAHEIAAGGQGRAAVIEDEADRMSSLVEGLLELSQLDAGALRLNREINTLDDLVGAALQRAQSVLHDHRVDVTFAGDGLVTGVFDFSQALRALTNILENAAKYSPPGAPIGVRVAGNGADVEVTVSDRGPGVPVAERDRVFEPFYRIPGVAPDVRGAGLGLSIARRFARAQGGDLVVADAPGGGAAFTLRLPAHAEQTA
ncbi:MAG TPA: ATP-binding protein, partial [Gemmatimonadaceae bacterium]|nr:ATP-binding protein [Gemmatimonadaceae bacterium]